MIYLACPYSDSDPLVMEQRFIAVNKAASILMGNGLFVFSPISHGHPIAQAGGLPTNWEYWEGYCDYMLRASREFCLFLNDGWEQSVGARGETLKSMRLYLPISTIRTGDFHQNYHQYGKDINSLWGDFRARSKD